MGLGSFWRRFQNDVTRRRGFFISLFRGGDCANSVNFEAILFVHFLVFNFRYTNDAKGLVLGGRFFLVVRWERRFGRFYSLFFSVFGQVFPMGLLDRFVGGVFIRFVSNHLDEQRRGRFPRLSR